MNLHTHGHDDCALTGEITIGDFDGGYLFATGCSGGCTPNPNFHFILFFCGFWVQLNIPWHSPLVFYDPNLSHAS